MRYDLWPFIWIAAKIECKLKCPSCQHNGSIKSWRSIAEQHQLLTLASSKSKDLCLIAAIASIANKKLIQKEKTMMFDKQLCNYVADCQIAKFSNQTITIYTIKPLQIDLFQTHSTRTNTHIYQLTIIYENNLCFIKQIVWRKF